LLTCPLTVRLALATLALGSLCACGASEPEPAPGPGPGGNGSVTTGGTPGAGGSNPQGGGSGGAGNVQGGAGGMGNPGGGQTAGGSAGATAGGSAGSDSGGTGGSGVDAGDTPPWRPLNVTAAKEEHRHSVAPNVADPMASNATGDTGGVTTFIVDPRAPKMMGKLLISLGVGGGSAWSWASKRGFHSMGVDFYQCDLNYETREHNGDCRLEAFDGMDRTPQMVVDYHDSIVGHVTEGLKYLHQMAPEEDWGYFLNEAQTEVRWSDVAVTGFSHGAQSAARFARAYRMFRAVSRSGPRDNQCGEGNAGGMDYDPANPPFDPACPDDDISAWLDEESKTPVERLFGFVGKEDGQYGDIMFGMERMKYVGMPLNISKNPNPPFNTNRFYGDVGHSGFDDGSFDAALEYAFGIPPENSNPAF
jgi:hypothetical protein